MIAIGCDHGGLALKGEIINHLKELNYEFNDMGTYDEKSVDYPDIAKKVCAEIIENRASLGILVCGTGIGMSMAANKYDGIRAAVCGDTFSARMTRMHNDANMLCIGARVTGVGLAKDILDAFLDAEFEGGRHQIRVDMISEIEKSRS